MYYLLYVYKDIFFAYTYIEALENKCSFEYWIRHDFIVGSFNKNDRNLKMIRNNLKFFVVFILKYTLFHI